MDLNTIIDKIEPEDSDAREAAHNHWCNCAKPLGGLGLLETVLEDIAAVTGTENIDISKRRLIVMCSDNGVVAQGVSQSSSEITKVIANGLANHQTPVCKMADVANCDVFPVDLGIFDYPNTKGINSLRVRNGTYDITKGPAMTIDQVNKCIFLGIEVVREAKEEGYNLIVTGEAGIGNTTTTSCVASVLLDIDPCKLTGRGAGLSDDGLLRKINAIKKAIEINSPDKNNVIDVLSKVGGLDIAGLCGVFLGGALYNIPVLIDGVISAVSALCAQRLCPNSAKAMIATHVSFEPASKIILEALGKQAFINAGMHLGEGTGAVAAIPLLDMACAVYNESYTFKEANMDPYKPLGGKE